MYQTEASSVPSGSECEGFDLQAGQSWIYPINYSLREYQYNIIEKALFQNTLVSLPTGLGKTFIAAVVMYNFYRWYPQGKIIFLAPTKPLVKQQIDACFEIVGIPKKVTAELTGSKTTSARGEIWQEKRVFFATPQTLQNDLGSIIKLGKQIKCIVFDEAHKAKGHYAYCEVIQSLSQVESSFRVLALSATPGNTINDVIEVANNLLISHLEFRTEESEDVKSYVFKRSIETIVVPLGEKLTEVKETYLRVLDGYTRPLMKFKVLQGNCANYTKGRIFMIMKEFQKQSSRTKDYGEIMKGLNACVTLYHAYDLLIKHGLRSFLNFFQEHIDKPLLRGNALLIKIMQNVKDYLGEAPNIDLLPDGTHPPIPSTTKFGHNKFYKLEEILQKHFQQSEPSSRVIVFFEYRESVIEAFALLNQAQPLIKPRIFLGQSSGNSQKTQLNVVKAFREGRCNCLLSTSIGEEGLDVGNVDLIICFDISNKSPIRMVQRMGRTGRKKEGRVILLVTEGKEQQTLKDCLIQKDLVNTHVIGSKDISKALSFISSRMVPDNVFPRSEKLYICLPKEEQKQNTLKEMLKNIEAEPCSNLEDRLERLSLTKHKEKQRKFNLSGTVQESSDCKLFVALMQLIDSKRFNLPSSQVTIKQIDIRNMFSNCSVQKDSESLFLEQLLLEINNFNFINKTVCKNCFFEPVKIEASVPETQLLQEINKNSFKGFLSTPEEVFEDDLDIEGVCLTQIEGLAKNRALECNKSQLEEIKRFDEGEILNFFKLEAIEDLFEDDIISGSESEPGSPIVLSLKTKSKANKCKRSSKEENLTAVNIEDICDLSDLGFTSSIPPEKPSILIEDLVDLSDFDLETSPNLSSNSNKLDQTISSFEPVSKLDSPLKSPSLLSGSKRSRLRISTQRSSLNVSQIIDKVEKDKISSDEEFEAPSTPVWKKKHKVKEKAGFIDNEAEVSVDSIIVSSDEDESNLDKYEESFVNDESIRNCTQVHLNYLQSIRSPNNGVFKIPKNPGKVPFEEVFSQVPVVDDTYVHDSFCVEDDSEEVNHDLSELEILEKKLKEKKKRKKAKVNEAELKTKRRRIVVMSSDSD